MSDDDEPEMDTVWIFPPGADLSFFTEQPERVLEIAQRAFARAVREAIEENDRLGIPSYGAKTAKSPCADRGIPQNRVVCFSFCGNWR